MATLSPVLSSDYLELAEPTEAWEKILARIPAHARAVARVDDEAAARVVEAYQRARQELADDIDRRWAKTFGANVAPTIDQRVRFVSSLETLEQLTARQSALANGNIGALHFAYDESVLKAIAHDTEQRALMAQHFPVLKQMDPFTPPPSTAQEIYVNKAVQDAGHIAKATRDAAALELATAALKGEGPDAMRRRLVPVFDGNQRRAELTTRYTAIRSYNEASRVHYGQMQDVLKPFGRTIYTMWIATEDERSCPICLALHGTIVGVEESFDITASFDKKPPSPPWPKPDVLTEPPRHARCRCTIAPWVDGWQHGTRFTPEAMQAEARRLAEKAGYSTSAPQPVRGAAPPRPSGPSWSATQIRHMPGEAFERAKASYLACVYAGPGGVPPSQLPDLLAAHRQGPVHVARHMGAPPPPTLAVLASGEAPRPGQVLVSTGGKASKFHVDMVDEHGAVFGHLHGKKTPQFYPPGYFGDRLVSTKDTYVPPTTMTPSKKDLERAARAAGLNAPSPGSGVPSPKIPSPKAPVPTAPVPTAPVTVATKATRQRPSVRAAAGTVPLRDRVLLEGKLSVNEAAALESIEKVHRLPSSARRVVVDRNGQMLQNGRAEYQWTTQGSTMADHKIVIKSRSDAEVITHEIGHFVDMNFREGGPTGTFSSLDGTSEMAALRDAFRASPALGRLRGDPQYEKSTQELFARGYAQWIATRSGNERLLNQVKAYAPSGLQWTASEFEPIGAAFDDLFRARGLL